MIYLKDYRDSESFPTAPTLKLIGTGHTPTAESETYNISQTTVKGK